MALPKRHRLRGHRAIDHLHRQGRRHHSTHLLLRVAPAKDVLLPPPDRRAPSSGWRCALVISAKVHKRAVVRNRLRRLLHRHLLASLRLAAAAETSGAVRQGPPAVWPADSAAPSASAGGVRSMPGQSQRQPAGSTPGAEAMLSPVEGAEIPAAASCLLGDPLAAQPNAGAPMALAPITGGPMAGRPAERDSEATAPGRPAAGRPIPEPPIWLMVSLRPGSAELDADQLLGECTIVLRRAGLIR
ncbi:MAG: ribonuclease P protein component [Synechococcaceae cyanobacterium]